LAMARSFTRRAPKPAGLVVAHASRRRPRDVRHSIVVTFRTRRTRSNRTFATEKKRRTCREEHARLRPSARGIAPRKGTGNPRRCGCSSPRTSGRHGSKHNRDGLLSRAACLARRHRNRRRTRGSRENRVNPVRQVPRTSHRGLGRTGATRERRGSIP
jgi:hypothetical protein